MKEIVKRTLKRFDIDISRSGFRKTIDDYIANRNIDLVFDVGANVGQFATSLRGKGYTGQIESFEPVASVFNTLAEAARSDPRWNVHNLALGTEPGKATINISDSSVFSSLLPTTNAATAFAETAASRRTEEIEVSTLDHFASLMAGANTLLKIDTQGFEKQVLLGAKSTLSSIKGVLMELPIIQLYEGNWQFHEAIAFMAEAGFVPAQIHPVNFHWIDEVSLVEVDCLFRPRDSRLDAHPAA